MRRGILRFSLLAALATQSSFAQNSRQYANVTGWRSVASASNILTYNRDGDEKGYANLGGRAISGVREWRPDLDIVDVGGGLWVDSSALNLVYCQKEAGASPVHGRPASTTAGTYGSGNGC